MTVVLPLWEILVPYKIGRKNVQVPYHQEWDAKVVAITGGMTLMKAAKGSWVSPKTGKVHKEIMIPVRVACSEEQIRENHEDDHCSLQAGSCVRDVSQ